MRIGDIDVVVADTIVGDQLDIRKSINQLTIYGEGKLRGERIILCAYLHHLLTCEALAFGATGHIGPLGQLLEAGAYGVKGDEYFLFLVHNVVYQVRCFVFRYVGGTA